MLGQALVPRQLLSNDVRHPLQVVSTVGTPDRVFRNRTPQVVRCPTAGSWREWDPTERSLLTC